MAAEARSIDLDQVLADPPQVHPSAPQGVWSTDRACYEFLQDVLTPGMRTLETGLGVSTVVFVLAGTIHTAVFPYPVERDGLLAYCRARSLSTDNLELALGGSDVVLPKLERTLLDVVLIDGCHAFPFPQLDWFYAASRLRYGGILVVDDLQLPAPLQLASFLDADTRWRRLRRTDSWVAYIRESEGTLNDSWTDQPFFGSPGYQLRGLARTLEPKVKAVARRGAQSARRLVR